MIQTMKEVVQKELDCAFVLVFIAFWTLSFEDRLNFIYVYYYTVKHKNGIIVNISFLYVRVTKLSGTRTKTRIFSRLKYG